MPEREARIARFRAERVLLIGTNNAGKRRELQALFEDLDLHLVTPAERGLALDPVENGATFEDNAAIKARAFSQASGLPALCDDSGLCVDALNGAPGIHSARFAASVSGGTGSRRTSVPLDHDREEPAARTETSRPRKMVLRDQDRRSLRDPRSAGQDAANVTRLLGLLEHTPDDQRRARFVCVMALVFGEQRTPAALTRGEWEGMILRAPRGTGGFGYDPVFYSPEQGLTAAQMPAALKNRLSHRARAAVLMKDALRRWLDAR